MNILFNPQVNDSQTIYYRFMDETITVTIKGDVDVFDFNGLPIGQADGIETILPVNPIIRAERKDDGQLYVELVKFITEDASEDEKYPTWMVV